ncbi:MAG: LysM peptidoglycan-binding domain-containing protein [Candidatus Hydrogenedentes bacterium]|nr:LysM peptidoglycan-binding domain-containing protein [Candidatus Hydrogenedentota bacterium]
MNIQVYKKPSPIKPIMLFLVGIIVGIALTYIFFQIYSPTLKTEPTVTQLAPAKTETATTQPTPEKTPPIPTTPNIPPYSIDKISPLIITIDMDKYTQDTLNLLNRIKPFAVRIISSSDSFKYNKYLEIAKTLSNTLQKENQGLPLIAVDSELLFLKALPQFEVQPTIAQLREEIDPNKIIEAGENYARTARSLGIRMIIGPMIELFVPGKSDESKKDLYFSDSTEILQLAGLSFVKGLIKGGVIPVVKTFPAKTIAEKKEVDGRIILTLETPYNEGDINQAISMLATWLFPFSESARESVSAILVSHTAIPILQQESPIQPCSVSEKIIRGLIRDKWKYDGLLIAEDLAEYPLTQGENFSDVSLKMIGVGIDILSTSLTDEAELVKTIELIRNNLTEEAKNKINLRLSSALSKIHPIETDIRYYQPPAQPEPTLIAKQETPDITPQPPSPSLKPETEIPPPDQKTDQSTETAEKITESPQPAQLESPPSTEITSPAETPQPPETKEPESKIQPPANTEETSKPDVEQTNIPQSPPPQETPKPTTQGEKISPPPSSPKPQEKVTPSAQQKTTLPSPPPNTKPILHKISPGDTLFSVARRYGVTPKEIISWNNIDNPNLIKHGFKLTIYVPEGTTPTQQQAQPTPKTTEPPKPQPPVLEPMSIPSESTPSVPQPQPEKPPSETPTATTQEYQQPTQSPQETIIYTVKHGDTLDTISRDFRVSKEEIIRMNNLKKPYILPAGRKLRIPKIPKVGFNQ